MGKVLVTGAAGFIGYHMVKRLLNEGFEVVGLDSVNDYYDPALKWARLAKCGIRQDEVAAGKICHSSTHAVYQFVRMQMEDGEALMRLFAGQGFDYVVHLAAQAGVRYSLTHPMAYVDANLSGFMQVLEACRSHVPAHLVYASSSSVYGSNTRMPFSADDPVDHPVSLYAATKKANELMAHTYSHLYGIPSTGLRFFTVYGPWGRPDMALFLFTSAMLEGRPIEVFNHGEMRRDFTYIDDIIEGVFRVMKRPPEPAGPGPFHGLADPPPSASRAPYRVYNIGNSRPVPLMDFIHALEEALGLEAKKTMLPIQPGDVPATWADTSPLEEEFGYKPATPVEEGIKRFVLWYKSYYKLS